MRSEELESSEKLGMRSEELKSSEKLGMRSEELRYRDVFKKGEKNSEELGTRSEEWMYLIQKSEKRRSSTMHEWYSGSAFFFEIRPRSGHHNFSFLISHF